jgi:hypothetical protein
MEGMVLAFVKGSMSLAITWVPVYYIFHVLSPPTRRRVASRRQRWTYLRACAASRYCAPVRPFLFLYLDFKFGRDVEFCVSPMSLRSSSRKYHLTMARDASFPGRRRRIRWRATQVAARPTAVTSPSSESTLSSTSFRTTLCACVGTCLQRSTASARLTRRRGGRGGARCDLRCCI